MCLLIYEVNIWCVSVVKYGVSYATRDRTVHEPQDSLHATAMRVWPENEAMYGQIFLPVITILSGTNNDPKLLIASN